MFRRIINSSSSLDPLRSFGKRNWQRFNTKSIPMALDGVVFKIHSYQEKISLPTAFTDAYLSDSRYEI